MYKGINFIYAAFIFYFLVLTQNALAQEINLYYKFDEGSGSVVYDSSGYDQHGQVGGAIWLPLINSGP